MASSRLSLPNKPTTTSATSANRAARRAEARNKTKPTGRGAASAATSNPVAKAVRKGGRAATTPVQESSAPSVPAVAAHKDVAFASAQPFVPWAKLKWELLALLMLGVVAWLWSWLLNASDASLPAVLQPWVAEASRYQLEARWVFLGVGFLLACSASRQTAAFALVAFATATGFAFRGSFADFFTLMLTAGAFGLFFSYGYLKRHERGTGTLR